MSRFDPTQTVLAGLDSGTLTTWLNQAQAALQALNLGQREVHVAITGGGQHREVSFQKADQGSLVQWIKLLQAQLGLIRRPRRAIGVTF